MHAVKVPLKSIDVSRPKPAELSQPGIDLLKSRHLAEGLP
jgi:hypothetical protein